jgi:hypothetical protein
MMLVRGDALYESLDLALQTKYPTGLGTRLVPSAGSHTQVRVVRGVREVSSYGGDSGHKPLRLTAASKILEHHLIVLARLYHTRPSGKAVATLGKLRHDRNGSWPSRNLPGDLPPEFSDFRDDAMRLGREDAGGRIRSRQCVRWLDTAVTITGSGRRVR